MIKKIKEFFKANKNGLIISSIILFLGAIVLHISQVKTFNPEQFFIWFPMYYGLFLFISMGFSYTFFGGND